MAEVTQRAEQQQESQKTLLGTIISTPFQFLGVMFGRRPRLAQPSALGRGRASGPGRLGAGERSATHAGCNRDRQSERPGLGLGHRSARQLPAVFQARNLIKNTPAPRRVFLAEWNQGDRQADRTLICKRFAVNTPHQSLRRSCLAVLACSALVAQGAFAASASEQANLEVMIRQLNALEDTAHRSAQGADEPGQRFYFDYSRLAADLQRIRQGLQDYMTPSRAQPRDPSDLSGDYTLRGGPMP